MAAVVVYTQVGADSGVALAETLGVNSYCQRSSVEDGKIRILADTVISFGAHRYTAPNAKRILNPPLAVQLANRKLEVWEVLNKAGIPTPRLATPDEIGKKRILWRLPWHHAGKDIVVQEVGEQKPYLSHSEHRSPVLFVESKREYRVYVWMDKVVEVSRKWEPEDAHHPFLRMEWCWLPFEPKNLASPLYTNAINAVKQIGLDWGAVDILWAKDGRYVVLEVNTAPVLTEELLPKYAERIKEWMYGGV